MKSVLITGGSGSFGRAFTKFLLTREPPPDKIIIYSRGEHRQETMERAFADNPYRDRLRFYIGDVRDRDRLELAMDGVEVVVHAAAMKVVPKCEIDPSEAVKTNVGGADNVIQAALRCGVRAVVAISTDKAVAPVNLYGATKLCAEKMFLAANNYGRTHFAAIRYGNVSGSQGSVIPLWKMLRDRGSPVTVTDPESTRFWLTLETACFHVGWLIDNMGGGELFVPHMRAFRIGDLAEAMGVAIGPVTGLRPGEKLHESIVGRDEMRTFEATNYGIIGGFGDNRFAVGQPITEPISSDLAPRIPIKELRGMVEALRG